MSGFLCEFDEPKSVHEILTTLKLDSTLKLLNRRLSQRHRANQKRFFGTPIVFRDVHAISQPDQLPFYAWQNILLKRFWWHEKVEEWDMYARRQIVKPLIRGRPRNQDAMIIHSSLVEDFGFKRCVHLKYLMTKRETQRRPYEPSWWWHGKGEGGFHTTKKYSRCPDESRWRHGKGYKKRQARAFAWDINEAYDSLI